MGKKNVKTFKWDQRLQIQNLFMAFKQIPRWTRSTIERGRGCNKFVPVLRGNGTKIAPTGGICVQPPGEMSWIRGKLADHVGDHAVLSPEEVILVTSSGTELSHPRPSQSLNNSMQITSGQQYNVGEKPTVILYIYINRHVGTPEKH